jgi:hypothetical protein
VTCRCWARFDPMVIIYTILIEVDFMMLHTKVQALFVRFLKFFLLVTISTRVLYGNEFFEQPWKSFMQETSQASFIASDPEVLDRGDVI